MERSEQINELAAALAKVQGKLQVVGKDRKNDYYNSYYADLAAVWDAARQHLTDAGLAVIQMPVNAGEDRVGLTTMLVHTSGQFISETISAKFAKNKDGKVKDDAQGAGSAITYLRRYCFAAFVGVVSADEDDDGNSASGIERSRTRPRPQEAANMQHVGSDPSAFPDWFRVLAANIESCGPDEFQAFRQQAIERVQEMTEEQVLYMQATVNKRKRELAAA